MKRSTLSISENIKNTRENRGYSQEYMAEMLNISQQTYSLLEKNPEKVTLLRLQKISKILDVKLSFLINESYLYHHIEKDSDNENRNSTPNSVCNPCLIHYNRTLTHMENEVRFLRTIIHNIITKK